MRRLARRAGVLLMVVTGWSGGAFACPSCRDALARAEASSETLEPVRVTQGFNRSILLMAAMPFVILGTVGAALRRDGVLGGDFGATGSPTEQLTSSSTGWKAYATKGAAPSG